MYLPSLSSVSLSLYFLTSIYLSQTLALKRLPNFAFQNPSKKKLDKKSFRVAFEKRGTWLNELFDDVSGKTKEEKATQTARVCVKKQIRAKQIYLCAEEDARERKKKDDGARRTGVHQ